MSHLDAFESPVVGETGRGGLHVRDVSGEFRPATADEVLEAARIAVARKFRRGSTFTSPEVVKHYLRAKLAQREHEVFALLLLDTRHRLIEYVELFRGSIDGAAVHPREVVKTALARNAAAVLLAHNHPSGVAEARPFRTQHQPGRHHQPAHLPAGADLDRGHLDGVGVVDLSA